MGLSVTSQKIAYPEQYDYNEYNYYLKNNQETEKRVLILCDIENNKEDLDSLRKLLSIVESNYQNQENKKDISLDTVLLGRMHEAQKEKGLHKFLSEFDLQIFDQIIWIRNIATQPKAIFYPGVYGYTSEFSKALKNLVGSGFVILSNDDSILKKLDDFQRSILVIDRTKISVEILKEFENRETPSGDVGYKPISIQNLIILNEPDLPLVILIFLSVTSLITLVLKRRFKSIFLVIKKNLFRFIFYYFILLLSTLLSYILITFLFKGADSRSELPMWLMVVLSIVISNIIFAFQYGVFAHRLIPQSPVAFQSMLLPASVSLFIWSLFTDLSLSVWFFPILLVCFPQKNAYQRRFYVARYLVFVLLIALLVVFAQSTLESYISFASNRIATFVFVIFCFSLISLNLLMASLSIRKNSGKRPTKLNIVIISSVVILALVGVGIFKPHEQSANALGIDFVRRQAALSVESLTAELKGMNFNHPLGLNIPLYEDIEIPDTASPPQALFSRHHFEKYDQVKIRLRGLSAYSKSQVNFASDTSGAILGSNFLFVEDSATSSHLAIDGFVSPELSILLQVKPGAKIFVSLDSVQELGSVQKATIKANTYLGLLP